MRLACQGEPCHEKLAGPCLTRHRGGRRIAWRSGRPAQYPGWSSSSVPRLNTRGVAYESIKPRFAGENGRAIHVAEGGVCKWRRSVEEGRLFIAPAGCHMTVGPGGSVKLEDGPKVRHARSAADRLFESAARAFGPRVAGVVLTVGDHDGTDGLQAIKDVGGICIVQDPADAQNPAMPLSAIQGDHPHIVLALSEIPLLPASLVRG
jgi:hypothetical protein